MRGISHHSKVCHHQFIQVNLHPESEISSYKCWYCFWCYEFCFTRPLYKGRKHVSISVCKIILTISSPASWREEIDIFQQREFQSWPVLQVVPWSCQTEPESPLCLKINQSDASIQDTWSVWTNERPVFRSHDQSGPIRGGTCRI